MLPDNSQEQRRLRDLQMSFPPIESWFHSRWLKSPTVPCPSFPNIRTRVSGTCVDNRKVARMFWFKKIIEQILYASVTYDQSKINKHFRRQTGPVHRAGTLPYPLSCHRGGTGKKLPLSILRRQGLRQTSKFLWANLRNFEWFRSL